MSFTHATKKAAARLLDTCAPEGSTEPAEVQNSAALATALQATIISAVVNSGDGESIVLPGLASTVGWFLTVMPREQWAAALNVLVQQSLLAANAHATMQADEERVH